MPVPGKNPEERSITLRKLILICVLVPFFAILGGFTASRLHETLAGVNGKVQLARTLLEPARDTGEPETFVITAFKSSGKPVSQVYAEASVVFRQFYIGSWILGCFLGLVFGIILARRLIITYQADYTPNKGTCFSCMRCVDYCPVTPEEVKP
jgi:ferredoxin